MRRILFLASLAGAALLIAPGALAGKPGGGTPPSGTIYFTVGGAWLGDLHTIQADGTGETSLALQVTGAFSVSHALHGGKRWLLYGNTVPGTNPDTAEKAALFAVDESGTTNLQLTNGDVRVCDVAWVGKRDGAGTAADERDRWVSFVGIEWFGPGATDANSHVYRWEVDWSSGQPALVGNAETVVTGSVNGSNNLMPRLEHPDWSAFGAKVVYEALATSGSSYLMVTAVGGATTDLGNVGYDPEWAPDDGRIAFWRSGPGTSLFTIKPDGTGLFQVSSGKGMRHHSRPHWSPDSAHLAFTNVTSTTGGVARIPAAGGSITTVRTNGRPIAWR